MSETIRRTRNWKCGARGAALAVALGLLQIPPLGPWLEHLSYDLLFSLRPKIKPTEAIIIAMDEKSHDELHASGDAAWDRGVHARLVRRLTECRAKAVVFDVRFDKESTNDVPFLNAIKAATNAGTRVIVGGTVEEAGHTDKFSGGTTLAPFEKLEQIAPWGFAERSIEGRILRQHYVGAEGRGEWVPSLSWRAAELITGADIGNPAAVRWINYYGPNGTLPTKSFHEALRPDLIRDSVFSNQVCFVGAHPPKTPFSAPTVADVWRTPFTFWGDARMPGVDIVTTVYLNLVRQDWLRRLSVGVEALLIVAVGVLFGWGLTFFRPTIAAGLGIGGMLAVTAVACALMTTQQLWFSWMIVVLEQIPVSIAWSVRTHFVRLAREQEALATQLAAAQTALKEAATSEAATRIDPSTVAEQIKTASANAPTIIAAPPNDGRPVVPDHELVRRVGKGAYGEVWLARNVIGTYHAVKIVKREDFQSDVPFEREFKGIQKFMPISRSHAGFVQILHAGRNHQLGYIYYIMETADDEKAGQEIDPDTYTAKNLAREIKKRGHLPAAECLQLSLDLCAALDYLHQQHLIHRDIKPSNIIFVKGVPKFADIGLVTDIAPTGLETTFLGTFGYIPPEGPGTPSADVFSLGMVLYEASTGKSCQQFPEASSTIRDRSDSAEHFQLNEIILKACQKDRSERYLSAVEMREDLLKLLRSTKTQERL